ncbi:MAG TPA: hypothetical protein VKB38_22385 [Terracidiphilus sp.]|nr:hypothetical protein [Terracidiphilus sp.]
MRIEFWLILQFMVLCIGFGYLVVVTSQLRDIAQRIEKLLERTAATR